jgi:hypothetical protein
MWRRFCQEPSNVEAATLARKHIIESWKQVQISKISNFADKPVPMRIVLVMEVKE